MSKTLSDKDVSVIATQTGIDPDVIRSWHKGNEFENLTYAFVFSAFNKCFILDFIKECPSGNESW